MTTKNLLNIIENSNRRIHCMNEYNEKLKEVEGLINNSADVKTVFEFFNIRKPDIRYRNSSINDIYYNSFLAELSNINPNDTNKIYVYIGSFMSVHIAGSRFQSVSIPYGHSNYEFRIYQDIESNNSVIIRREKCEQFEKENTILSSTDMDAYSFLKRVRCEFITSLIEEYNKKGSINDALDNVRNQMVKSYVLSPIKNNR